MDNLIFIIACVIGGVAIAATWFMVGYEVGLHSGFRKGSEQE